MVQTQYGTNSAQGSRQRGKKGGGRARVTARHTPTSKEEDLTQGLHRNSTEENVQKGMEKTTTEIATERDTCLRQRKLKWVVLPL